eukprot:scaffold1568_cov200-Pinguiococcus_pyrenoidosus.AAC.2
MIEEAQVEQQINKTMFALYCIHMVLISALCGSKGQPTGVLKYRVRFDTVHVVSQGTGVAHHQRLVRTCA